MEKHTVDKDTATNYRNALQKMMLKMQAVGGACSSLIEDDFNKKDFSLMVFIGKKQKVKMSEIAEFMTVSMSTATGMIDRLVAGGYLVRENSQEDRRIVYITFSKKGIEMFSLFESKLDEFAGKVLEIFSPEEQQQYISFMERGAK